jgi:hypothetical protein
MENGNGCGDWLFRSDSFQVYTHLRRFVSLAFCTTDQAPLASMPLRVIDNAGNWSMFEMDWVIVP